MRGSGDLAMSNEAPFRIRDWLVPPIIIPLFCGLIVVGMAFLL